MSKKTKMMAVFAVVLGMIVGFAGCGNGGDTNPSGNGVFKQKIDIKDIDWHVDEGVVNGDRYVLLNFTNNTPYTIVGFEMTFKEKAGITEEEKNNYYSELQKIFERSDEEMEEFKSRSISAHTLSARVVNPGETASNINCYYYAGIFYMKDLNHFNLVEPDIATIKYIDADQIYTVYYDYGSNKYSTETDTKTAYQWSHTDLGNKIPKPDVKVLVSNQDNEKIFMFEAYGLSLEQFNAYVEACRELGYTIEVGSFEGFYSADNTEGYDVYLNYNEKNQSMSGSLRAPEAQSE